MKVPAAPDSFEERLSAGEVAVPVTLAGEARR